MRRTIIRKLIAAVSLTMLAGLTSVPAAATAAAATPPQPAAVQLSHQATRIASDGSVRVVMWVRCHPRMQGFEYNIGV